MPKRALAIFVVLTSACTIAVPPRSAFVAADADTAGEADAANDVAADATAATQDTVGVDADAAKAPDGAAEVEDGGSEVQDGGSEVQDGASEVQDGASEVEDSASEVQDGGSDVAQDTADVDLCAGVSCTDLPCATQACNPKTGSCVATAKIDGWACDDGKKCTAADACASGVCTGTAVNCDDGNACTNDSCNPSQGCVNTIVKAGTACDDGDPCTIGDVCAGKTCGGSAALGEKTFGDTGNDVASAIVATSDGGFALAGWSSSPGTNGGDDFWLVKVTAAGVQSWSKWYGSATSDDAHGLVQTSDGGFALAGETNAKSGGQGDFWLVRTDGNGGKLWDQTYGGSAYDVARGVVQVGDGGFALAGLTNSKGAGQSDAWLVRTDGSGVKLWDQTYGGAGKDFANAIAQPSDGGFALAGSVNGDFLLVRTDADGNALWTRAFDGGAQDEAQAITPTSDGGFALGGFTGAAFWLVRTDATGNKLWDRSYGGIGFNAIQAIAATNDDGFALAGIADTNGLGAYNLWTARTDSLGNKLWEQKSGGASAAVGWGIARTATGGFAVAGRLTSNQQDDAWLLRTDFWGNATCASSGLCLGFTYECDDANSCTADLCGQGTAGCWHANLADTAPCASGDACKTAETCTAGACGGGGAKLFDQKLSGSGGASGYSGVAVAPGGFVIGGTSTATSPSQARLVRTDTAGGVVWDKTFSLGSYSGSVAAVLPTANGFAAAGSVASDNNSEDVFLLLTDSAGATFTVGEFGTPGSESGNALAEVSDGFVIAGRSGPVGSPAMHDALLVKVDAAGNQVWLKTFGGGNGAQDATAISALGDGLIVAGWIQPAGAPVAKVWLLRTDLAGNKLWAQSYGTTQTDGIDALAALTDGFAVTGSTTATGPTTLTRVDASGAVQWTRSYTGTGASAALAGVNGGFVLTGTATGGYVLRVDDDGVALWQHTAASVNSGVIGLNDGLALVSTATGQFDLARTDLWGNASCAASGSCVSLNFSDCDDANPCTADLCDAADNGCWHSNLPDGTACGYGATCGAGACVCAPGYVAVSSGAGQVCAADSPVWGELPPSPTGLSDNGDGTVSDSATGLTWQQADPGGTALTWDNANAQCIALQLGGQNDWRLPTLAELNTLIDFNKSNPATANVLQTNVTLGYWSASSLAGAANNRWVVSFVVGDQAAAQTTSTNHVRCVRGSGAVQTGTRFTTAASTVSDAWTQLTWQRTADPGTWSASGASSYCAGLVIEGSTGWRLPTIVELRGLIDRSHDSPALDGTAFPAAPSAWFWASGSTGGSPSNVWSVDFTNGKSEGSDKSNGFQVRCVK